MCTCIHNISDGKRIDSMNVYFEDRRLLPIREKVEAGERLSYDDGVTLYRTNGNVLGSTTTSSSGRWKITASGSAGITLGHFYAKVKRRSEGTAGTTYVCKAAVSPTIPYHQ